MRAVGKRWPHAGPVWFDATKIYTIQTISLRSLHVQILISSMSMQPLRWFARWRLFLGVNSVSWILEYRRLFEAP